MFYFGKKVTPVSRKFLLGVIDLFPIEILGVAADARAPLSADASRSKEADIRTKLFGL